MAGAGIQDRLDEEETKIFYERWRALQPGERYEVAAVSIVTYTDETNEIFKSRNLGSHAEVDFINQVVRSRSLLKTPVDIKKITINISRSPCFSCREELENFLKSLKTRVTFRLRIANLYCGEGNEDKSIKDLVYWLSYIMKNIVDINMLDIQPISVVTEVPDYTPQGAEPERIRRNRIQDDTRIRTIVDRIMQTVEQQRTIPENPRLFLKEVKTKLKTVPVENLKRKFYESHATATSKVYVAVAKMRIEAVNTAGSTKQKVFEMQGVAQCCLPILTRENVPSCWIVRSLTIELTVTYWPCENCLARITRNVHNVEPRLKLRVANIPDRKIVVDWLFERYQAEGPPVQLHAFPVAAKLPRVPQDLTREQSDIEAEKAVRQIKDDLTRRKFNEEFERLARIQVEDIIGNNF